MPAGISLSLDPEEVSLRGDNKAHSKNFCLKDLQKNKSFGRMWHLMNLENVGQFIEQGLRTEGNTNVGNIGAGNVIACHSFTGVIWSQPVLFHLEGGGIKCYIHSIMVSSIKTNTLQFYN